MGAYKIIAGVYAITSSTNKKSYIGYSTNIKKRWDKHKYELRRNIHANKHLQNAWNSYGESTFSFVILETLKRGLNRQEYEKVETKWVLFYKSHLKKFGYNSCLPGAIPLKEKGQNISKRKELTIYKCINMVAGTVVSAVGTAMAAEITGIKINKISDLANYWVNKSRLKSKYGWIIVREGDYQPDFDYINHKKKRTLLPPEMKKTWRASYYANGKHKRKLPSERNIKRVPIIAVDKESGKETFYPSIKDASRDFIKCKIYLCINSDFGKHQHRGHYFKRAIS